MFGLVFQTIVVAVRAVPHSFGFAAPVIILSAFFAGAYWEFTPPPFVALLAVICSLVLVPPYLSAALDVMLSPESPPTFKSAFSWHRHQIDFFIFTVGSLLFLGILIGALGDIARDLHQVSQELEAEVAAEQVAEHEKFGYTQGGTLIALFGSRLFAGAALLMAILAWNYFFRTAIKMPGHVDGYDINTEEAMSLTRHYSTQIMAVSLLINVGMLSFLFAVLPWGAAQWWMQAIMFGVIIWLFIHINMAMLVAMYWQYTEGYNKRPLRSF